MRVDTFSDKNNKIQHFPQNIICKQYLNWRCENKNSSSEEETKLKRNNTFRLFHIINKYNI